MSWVNSTNAIIYLEKVIMDEIYVYQFYLFIIFDIA